MPNIGPLEIVVVLVLVLIIFGPRRLPELGRSLGKGIREFKQSVTGEHDGEDDDQPKLQTGQPAESPSNAPTGEDASRETDHSA